MSRPDRTHIQPHDVPVPEIEGKAKHGKIKARPIIAGTGSHNLKVYHATPFSVKSSREKPIPDDIYPVIDTDLGRDNLENDITEADLQDL